MALRLIEQLKRVGARRILALGAAYIATLLILLSGVFTGQTSLKAGQIAQSDIYAPRRAINQPLYQALRQTKVANVKPVYVTDARALPSMQQKISKVFSEVVALRSSLPTGATAGYVQAAWTEQIGIALTQTDLMAIVKLTDPSFSDLNRTAQAVAARVLGQANYTPAQMPAERSALSIAVEALGLSRAAETYFLTAVERSAATPNMRISPSETLRAQNRALLSVPQPYIEQGQLLVQRGARVSQADIAVVREFGLLNSQQDWPAAAGAAVFAAGFLALLVGYLLRFRPQALRDETRLTMLLAVAVGELLFGRLALLVSPYFVPLAAAAMLLAVISDARVGLIVSIGTVLLLQAMFGIDPRATVVLSVEAFVGAVTVQRLSERAQLFRAPLYMAFAGVVASAAIGLVAAPYAPDPGFWANTGWSVVAAVLSAALALGTTPIFESLFGVLTSVRLLELSNPNLPLLRRLLLEAPGTYYHSLVVSNLCGAACDGIGAQSLLARVGAFYHDVGKLRRPYFFVDNQTDGENPHDHLTPMLSTLVITAHVTDGLEIAREYRLPKGIQDFIGEHHGTTTVAYFHQRARELYPDNPPREEDFRYPGPKPQSRETAVLMLADTCEAAVRAMRGRTSAKIEALVRKLIHERLFEGQLDESDVTLRDLDVIGRAFVRVLTGVHHTRVEYTTEGLEELLQRGR